MPQFLQPPFPIYKYSIEPDINSLNLRIHPVYQRLQLSFPQQCILRKNVITALQHLPRIRQTFPILFGRSNHINRLVLPDRIRIPLSVDSPETLNERIDRRRLGNHYIKADIQADFNHLCRYSHTSMRTGIINLFQFFLQPIPVFPFKPAVNQHFVCIRIEFIDLLENLLCMSNPVAYNQYFLFLVYRLPNHRK